MCVQIVARREYFNSRPCVRGDQVIGRSQKQVIIFQFTPLREGRLWTVSHSEARAKFQFTPLREGRRVNQAVKQLAAAISIHAPA